MPFDCDGRRDLIVPKNLYIIATMNSSDRSIGHIDVAIRRRFGMFLKEPRPEVVQEVWSGIDEAYGEQLASLLGRLNGDIQKNNHETTAAEELGVGHSYFLPAERTDAKEQVRRKWLYQVQPLLQEYAKLLATDSLKGYFKKKLDECLT